MKVTNNQQQTAFKSNTIVRFANTTLSNMEGLASLFAEMKGIISHENVGRPILLDDGKSVLVPDKGTSLGNIIISAYYTAFSKLQHFFKDTKTCAEEALKNPQVKEFLSLIELDRSTERIDYKEVL